MFVLSTTNKEARRLMIILVQPAQPDYRLGFISALREEYGAELCLAVGNRRMDATVTTSLNIASDIPTKTLVLGPALIQWGALRAALRADVAVLDLNPRNASTWIALVCRSILRRPSIVWGHGSSRSTRAGRLSRALRMSQVALSNAVLVYTETEAIELRARSQMDGRPGGRMVLAMHNATSSALDMHPNLAQTTRPSFVVSGRLVEPKRPLLALRAYALALSQGLPPQVRLIFIGDGPLRSDLERLVAELSLCESVDIMGPVWDIDALRDCHVGCIAGISPGYAGLNVIQSLGFGTRVLVADDEPHAPEIEAVHVGQNGDFFEARSDDALAQKMLQYAQSSWSDQDRVALAENTGSLYSVEHMAESFRAAVSFAGADR